MTDEPKPKVRLYVDNDLGSGARLDLDRSQSHYLLHVMRLGVGGVVALFNGRDGEWQTSVEATRKNICTLLVERRTRRQVASPDLWLVFAPVKRAPIDYLAAKATELGVSAIRPVMTRHTVVNRVNVERMRANAVEAAEQCGRLDVPEVFAPEPLDGLLGRWPTGRRLLLCDETGGAPPVAEVLAKVLAGAWNDATSWAIFIGPEGGFAAPELDAFRKLKFSKEVSLGPRILRAETAAVAALACWQALLGDWRTAGKD